MTARRRQLRTGAVRALTSREHDYTEPQAPPPLADRLHSVGRMESVRGPAPRVANASWSGALLRPLIWWGLRLNNALRNGGIPEARHPLGVRELGATGSARRGRRNSSLLGPGTLTE